MGFFSKFENKMEDTFDNIGDKMFDSPISPVQIAKKAEKQMRRNKMLGAGKQYAPTLYTVLVNKDDDARLFGYYPTLAGETETYLEAKANEASLAMDGHPLVRFIVDEDLKHGKFDVIAEAVAGSIVEQLRIEENERYGLDKANQQRPKSVDSHSNFPQSGMGVGVQESNNGGFNNPSSDNIGQEFTSQPGSSSTQNSQSDGYSSPFEPYDPNALFQQQQNNSYENNPYHDINKNNCNNNSFDSSDASVQQMNLNANHPAQVQQVPAYSPQSQPQPAPQKKSNDDISFASNGVDQHSQQMLNVNDTSDSQSNNQNNDERLDQFGIPAASAPTSVFAGGLNINPTSQNFNNYGGVPSANLRDITTGKIYNLNSSTIVIGRDNSCNIVIPDVNASRQHAQILYNNGVWMLNDLGSTNGTYINNYEINSGQLNSGDVITIGVTNLAFNIG